MSPNQKPLRSWILVSFGVFCLALSTRLLHVWGVADAAFFPLHMGDAADHHRLGQEIAAGDWLGRGVFFHAPLYPYFLGVVYSVLGSSPLAVRLVQTLLGALSAVFVAQAGNRLFGWRTGVTAGVLLALYAPAVYYDTIFQDSVLDLFFGSLALWMLAEAVVRPGIAYLFATGLALGAFQLSRENATILLIPILAWVALRPDLKPKGRFAAATVLMLGFATALAPLVVRNALTSGDLLPGRRLQLGINLYIGNNPEADGYYRPLRAGRGNPQFEMEDAILLAEQAEGRELTLAEVSDHWIERTIDYVVRDPLDWLGLMARKTGLVLNHVEASDTEDLYTYADHSPILQLTRRVLDFGVLFALAVIGTWVTWPRRRELAVFYALPAIYLLGVLVFFVFGRYRHPAAPFLVLLAAAGLAGLPQFIRERGRRRVVGVLGVMAFLLALSHLPLGMSPDMLRAHTYTNVGAILEEEGDLEAAGAQYAHALEIAPGSAKANQFLGSLLHRVGSTEAALQYLERGVEEDPADPRIRNDYGIALAGAGRESEALEQFGRAVELDPLYAEAHANAGKVVFRTASDPSEAAVHFRLAVERAPGNVEMRQSLVASLLLGGEVEEGVDHTAVMASLAGPERATEVLLAAAWELAAGRIPGERAPQVTREILAAAPAFVPRDARYHRVLGAALASVGDYQGAVAAVERALATLGPNGERSQPGVKATLEGELARYRSGRPPPAPDDT
jgi:tetratricopeptide (TPR) repeat protein